MGIERRDQEELEKMVEELKGEVHKRKQAEESLTGNEEKARRLAHEYAIIAEIGRIISSTLDIEEVYGRFAEEVQKLIPFDWIGINVINPQDQSCTICFRA